eukprot:g12799.t1
MAAMSSSSSSATLAAVGGAEDMVTAVIDELKKTQEWRQNSFLPNSVLEVEVRFGRLRAREGNEYAGGKKGKGKKGGYQSLPARNCRAVELLAYDPDDSDDGEGSSFSSDRSRSREREQRQARTDHGGRREFAPASLRDMRLEEKEKLVMLDFLNVGGGPFDLRVSLSREKDLESERAKIENELGPEPQKNRKFTCVRKKRRFSYRAPAFPEASLDLTRVKQFGAAKNHAETREIEIELDAEAVRKAIEFGAEECARPLVSSLISVATTIASTDLASDLGKSLFKAEAGPEAGEKDHHLHKHKAKPTMAPSKNKDAGDAKLQPAKAGAQGARNAAVTQGGAAGTATTSTKVITNQAVLLADTTPSLVLNLLQSLKVYESAHPMLLPIAGVPLIEHILVFVKEYNRFCMLRYVEQMNLPSVEAVEGEPAFPQQISELFVMTKSRKVRNFVDEWERRNIDPSTDRIAVKILVPAQAEGGEMTAGLGTVGDVLSYLSDLHQRNVIQKDFFLYEPLALLQEPQALFDFFAHHHSIRQDKSRHCACTKLFAADSKEDFPPTHKSGALYLEKIEDNGASRTLSFSSTYELLHSNPVQKPDLGVIMHDLLKREGRGVLEVVKGTADLSMYMLTPEVLAKVATEAVDMTCLNDVVQNMLVDKFDSKLSSNSVYIQLTYQPIRSLCYPRSIVALSKELSQKLTGPLKKKKNADNLSAEGLNGFSQLARAEWFSGHALVARGDGLKLQSMFGAAANTMMVTNGEEEMKLPPASEELEVKSCQFFNPSVIPAECVLTDSFFLEKTSIASDSYIEKSIVCDEVAVSAKSSLNTGCFVGPRTAVPAGFDMPPGSVALPSFSGMLGAEKIGEKCAVLDGAKIGVAHLLANELGCLKAPAPLAGGGAASSSSAGKKDAPGDAEEDDASGFQTFDAGIWWSEHKRLLKFFDDEGDEDETKNNADGSNEPFHIVELRHLLEDFNQKFSAADADEPDDDDFNAGLLEMKSLRMAARASVPEFALDILGVVLDLLKTDISAAGQKSGSSAGSKETVAVALKTIVRLSPFLANFTRKLETKKPLVQTIHRKLMLGSTSTTSSDETDAGSTSVTPTLFVHILNAFRQFGDGDEVIDRAGIAAWHVEETGSLEQKKKVLENANLVALIKFCQEEDSDSEGDEDDSDGSDD